ncbi:MAG: hypothetical protein IKG69_09000 [Atopobiaceae bacterium]|nr:hypothetical protein [Atopobiaceae bacterium]
MTTQRMRNRAMRREQVERCLAADMSIKEWCGLNKVPESTMYRWMSVFRREEPDMFADPTHGEWIELSRGSIAARTALAVRTEGGVGPDCDPPAAEGRRPEGTNALVVRVNGADVMVPEGVPEPHLAMVLRAVAAL